MTTSLGVGLIGAPVRLADVETAPAAA